MTPGSDRAYRVRDLSHRYRAGPWRGATRALEAVNLSAARGEVQVLVGANGAGKSTLLQLLAGVRRPEHGEVEVLGHAAGSQAVRARVAFLPEVAEFPSRLKVRESLELQAALYAVPDAAPRIEGALADTGLEELAPRRLTRLSRGQRRRVSLAQALVVPADLLLLDEPLAGVDPLWCERLGEVLRRRAADGAAVVMSTHALEELRQLADQVALFEAGRLRAAGPRDEVLGELAGRPAALADLLRQHGARLP